jgi:large repetitive protein
MNVEKIRWMVGKWSAGMGLTLAMIPAAQGADLVWIGGTGDWNTAGKWSPAQVPTASDNAWVTNSGTYTVTVPAGTTASVASLTIGSDSGTATVALDRATLSVAAPSEVRAGGELSLLVSQSVLNGAGSLTVNGALNWLNGTISGTGALVIGSSGIVAIGSGGVTLGRVLSNLGSVNWAGGNFSLSTGSAITNLGGGTFELAAGGHVSGSATTPVGNAGRLLQDSGTGITVIGAPFNNSGDVQVTVGTLSLTLGSTTSGTVSNAAGAALNFGGGNHALTAGSVVRGAGTLTVSGSGTTLNASGTFEAGSTLSVSGGVSTLATGCQVAGAALSLTGNGVVLFNSVSSIGSLSMGAGTLGGTSPVTVTGPVTLSGGTVTNAMVIADGGLTISGNTTLNATKLVNPATAIWSAGNFTGANGAVFSNLVGATFINTFDGNWATGAGATPLFVNDGVFQKTNGTAALGTTSIDFQFINRGTVEVQTNTLRYSANQQLGGLTLLDGGNLAAQAQPLQILGGSLVGTGLVTVANVQNVVNSASVSPGLPLGEMDILGNYQQTATGILNIDLGGYLAGTNYDLVTVAGGGAGGVATLGGTLHVTLADGFTPTNGATFTFLKAASRVGAFASFSYPSNDIGMALTIDSTSATVRITNLKPFVANSISDPAPITYGDSFNLQFGVNTFGDPDNDPLTYTATGLPPGVTFSAIGRTFSGAPTQAGVFPVSVVASDNGTPSLRATNTFNFTVNPATLAVLADPQIKGYGDTDPTFSFSANGLQFSDTAAGVLTGSLSRTAGESVAGGPYAITQGSLTANGNYAISFTASSLAITPAPLSITAEAKTKVYGAADPGLSFTTSGLQSSDTAASVLSGSLSRTAGESVAGSPYAIAQGNLSANGNYAISFTGSSLAITPAPLSITAEAKTKVYGATDPALSFTTSGLQFTDTAASVLSGSLSRTSGETVAGGPYPITQGNLTANGNYAVSFTGSTLTISPAVLAVTADTQSKTYGAADPAFSFATSGLQFSDTAAGVLSGSLSRTAGEIVASSPYPITQGSLAANGNYTINFTGSRLTISPAALSVTAEAKTKVYGAPDPTLSFTTSGLQFTDTAASVFSGSLSRTAGESVASGPYAIIQGSLTANGNYTISFTGGSLAITPAPLSVTAESKTKAYGAADPAFTFTTSGLQFTDTAAGVLSGSLSRTAGESVANGPYAITQGSLTANGNYVIGFTGSSLAITPAQLLVTADSKTKTYGTTDPAFTASYSGFVNNEDPTDLGGILVLTRAVGETLGSYLITPAGLTSSNYAIAFIPGILTITAPAPRILSLTPALPNQILLTWQAVSNANYRVQFNSDVSGTNWTNLAGDVPSAGETASKLDLFTTSNRFYRVLVVP